MQELGFEKLDVYQKALDYIDTIFKITKDFPRHLQSSLRRSVKTFLTIYCKQRR